MIEEQASIFISQDSNIFKVKLKSGQAARKP